MLKESFKLWIKNAVSFLALNPIFIFVIFGAVAGVIIFGVIFSRCGNKQISPAEIRTEQEIIANTETQKLKETLEQSNAAVNAAMEPAKRAAENTGRAGKRKENVTGAELDKMARENQ